MKRLCVALAAIAGLLLIATPAQAGESMTVTGDFAPGGTVTVSGDHCVGSNQQDDAIPGEVNVEIVGGNPSANVASADNILASTTGDWSVDLTIATTAQPGEQYTVFAGCQRLSLGEPVNFVYPEVLQIMGEPVTPTTDTTAAPDTTAGPDEVDDPASSAAAAAATPTSPRLTG